MLHVRHHDSDTIEATESLACQSLQVVLIVTSPIWVDALIQATKQSGS